VLLFFFDIMNAATAATITRTTTTTMTELEGIADGAPVSVRPGDVVAADVVTVVGDFVAPSASSTAFLAVVTAS
jgi:hypothetical protein